MSNGPPSLSPIGAPAATSDNVPDVNTSEPSAELVEQVEQKLAQIEDTDVDPGQDMIPADSVVTEDESGSDPAGDSETAEDSTPSQPTLPAAYVRSLKADTWTDEEIQAGFEANPERFTAMAAKIHSGRNAESARWAALGRQTREQDVQPAPVAPVAPAVPQPATIPSIPEIDGVDQDTLAKLMAPIHQKEARLQTLATEFETRMETLNRMESQMVGQQMDTFFGSEGLKSFAELYGPSFREASDQQYSNRDSVLVLAHDMMTGAEKAGRSVLFDDALQIAHESVSKDFQETAIRGDIKSKTQKRAKSVSLRPSSKRTKGESGKPKTEAELVSQVEAGLKKAFGYP